MALTPSPTTRGGDIVFLDTSVLLAGLIDFGPPSAPAQQILLGVAERSWPAATAWHCCLEVYSVATRLPPEYRVAPSDASRLLQEEVLARMTVHDLPAAARASFFTALAQEHVSGGRIYDAHIADVARAASAGVIVTDNRRHFLAALRYGLRIETPAEFLSARRKRPSSSDEKSR